MTTQTPNLDKRTTILSAMLELVAEHGFLGTTMSMVVKKAGVSTGAVYHYFDSKDTLIHELYRDISRRFSAAILVGDPQNLPWPDDFDQMWLNSYNYYVSNPKEALFLDQYESSPYYDHSLKEQMARDDDENLRIIGEIAQKRLQDGSLRKMQPMVLYELTTAVAMGLAKRQIVGAIDLSSDELRDIAGYCRRSIEN